MYFILPFKFKIFKKKNGEWVYFEAKNFVLLIASLFFYFYGEPIYVILMVATILVNYIAGLLVDKFRGTVWSKVALWTSIGLSLASLGFFKYSDFFISNVNSIVWLGTSYRYQLLYFPDSELYRRRISRRS